MAKKSVDMRVRIARALMGLPSRGRPKGRQNSAKRSKRSIPKAWRDLDNECLKYALDKMPDDNWDHFVNDATQRARFHDRQGHYKIIKLTTVERASPRKRRTHEQRVRRIAIKVLEE